MPGQRTRPNIGHPQGTYKLSVTDVSVEPDGVEVTDIESA